MKYSLHRYLFIFAILLGINCHAQNVLNPSDTIVNYNPNNPPQQPPFGQIGKWVRTPDIFTWNTSQFKAYIYKGCAFRLMFPKSYNPTANDGKKYPIIISMHGFGERGPITDNESQLYHLAQQEMEAVDSGVFDGYLLYMQSQGYWGAGQYQYLTELVDSMAANNKVDPFHVCVHGLSAGGQGSWEMMFDHPNYVSCDLPMSSMSIGYDQAGIVNSVKYTPIWYFQGGLDGSPAPSTSHQVRDSMWAYGADFTYTEFSTLGHGCWDSAGEQPNFFPFMLSAYMSNPWPLYGRTIFCGNVSTTLGLASGLQAYQWRLNGVVIPGSVSDTLQVTQPGTYDAMVERNGVWSDWSHTPVVIQLNPAPPIPVISIDGLMSTAIPAADGRNYINLQAVNSNFSTYVWELASNDSIVGTQPVLTVTRPGNYILTATQQYGCSSAVSAPFTVINAGGANPPTPADNLVASPISNTRIKLNWSNTPSPQFTETAFELYRSNVSGGPYTFIGQMPTDTLKFVDSGLNINVKYFYRVRAINNTGASALSNEASASTIADTIPPSPPANLTVVSTDRNSIALSWSASTDNVGIFTYDVYINGVKTYSTPLLSINAGGLLPFQEYAFFVRARDSSRNVSVESNSVSAVTELEGLHYNFYEDSWDTMPNFNNYTPAVQGICSNVSIKSRPWPTNFGFLWQGYLHVPVSGNYVFQTTSDDGSRVWLGTYNPSAVPLVNNIPKPSGLNKSHTVSSASTYLQAGVYPISVGYFQVLGGPVMQLNWSCSQLYGNTNFYQIDSQYFRDTVTVQGTVPALPTNVAAVAGGANKITLSWNDNSNNETGFEVYRSQNPAGPFNIIATTQPNTVSLTDSGLQPSTAYYYRVQAINQFGGSGYDSLSVGGLKYSYFLSTCDTIPNIGTLINPVGTGYLTNANLSLPNGISNYAIVYSGIINIPATGSYNFYLNSNGGSKLYVNGNSSSNLVVNNNFVNPSSLGVSGKIQLNQGAYPFYVQYLETETSNHYLTLRYQGPKLAKQTIPDSAFINHRSSATTSPLPLPPAAPSVFTATALSPSAISLNWQDTATNETGYQILRSIADSSAFSLLTVVPPNSFSYTDSSLFSNENYFYKVSATGGGGTASASLSANAKTKDHFPVILKLPNISGSYNATTTINLTAADADAGDLLSFSSINLPSFATLVDNGNRTAKLTLNPSSLLNGNNYNVKIYVNDNNGGIDSTLFNITVNSNPVTTLDSVANYTVKDDSTLTIILNAHSLNNTMQWSFINMPSFIRQSGNPVLKDTLTIAPAYASIGSYTIQAEVADGLGGFATRQFNISVVNKPPQISPISSVTLKNNQQATVNITAVDDPADHIILSAAGLPSFATLTDNGNGTGTIAITPATGIVGVYTVTVIATDNSDSSASATFNISVVDNSLTSVYLNFSNGTSAPAPWNNLIGWPTPGSTFTNLFDDNNNLTNIAVTFPVGFQGVEATGMQTGGDNSAYPDIVMLTSEYEGTSNSDVINVSGLNPAKKYNFVFFNSSDNSYNGLTGFSLNGQTAFLNAAYNINKTVEINGVVSPTGSVSINVAKAAGAAYAFINSLVIQSYDSTVVPLVSPASLMATAKTTNSISLQWADRSCNETGFNILRACSSNNTYSLIATVGPNITNYKDSSLTSNQTYYYVVQAVQNTNVSGYSNILTASTYYNTVYINFNSTAEAPAPWNNLNAGEPQQGYIWNAFSDASGLPTSLGMEVTSLWAGLYTSGVLTGNNSGIYPDNVLSESYGLYVGQTGTLKITCLNLGMQYDFTFLGSSQFIGDVNTAYTVNGKTVILNASNNTQGTITLHGIVPDNNGTATISVAAADNTSQYGLINALIVQGYTQAAGSAPQPPQNGLSYKAVIKHKDETGTEQKTNPVNAATSLSAYPNPFHQYVNLSVQADADDIIEVSLFDISGREVYKNEFGGMVKGNNIIRIESNQNLIPGIYIARIFYENSRTFKSIELKKE